MTDLVHADLLRALDLLVLEHLGDGCFKQPVVVPEWWARLYPPGASGPQVRPGEYFPFLDNFLVDAEQFWAEHTSGRLKSGVWHETDAEGNECHLEAAAVGVGERQVLVIEFLGHTGDERQALIQKGREHELEHLRDLARHDREEELLRRTQDLLERKVAERTGELRATNRALQRENREKEVLLQEVHHRVKNNLQFVSSLLALQAQTTEDQRTLELFEDSRNRVRSMALIHEKIYQSGQLARIDLRSYIRDLVDGLFGSYSARSEDINLELHADDISVSVDTAIPCGLLVSELVSNALKHAVPADGRGEISIDLRAAAGDEIVLRIQDNGIGLPGEVDVQNPKTLGLKLVHGWVNQLRGTVEHDHKGGATFRIRFTASKP